MFPLWSSELRGRIAELYFRKQLHCIHFWGKPWVQFLYSFRLVADEDIQCFKCLFVTRSLANRASCLILFFHSRGQWKNYVKTFPALNLDQTLTLTQILVMQTTLSVSVQEADQKILRLLCTLLNARFASFWQELNPSVTHSKSAKR